ncbi:MAG: hypothetical protein IJV76_07470 [Clostridia bacterium]|nr:hypothetical protein [Clostridia bacterium]
MKKCKKCGAVQSDERSVCIDCGTLLGRPMSEAEEAQAEAALDDRLDGMAERAQDFYVSVPEKVMGILCILGVIAAVVMLGLVSAEKPKLEELVPDHIQIFRHEGGTTILRGFDPVTGENYEEDIPPYYYSRRNELENIAKTALLSGILCVTAAPLLLFPKFVWWLHTLRYRLWYDWEPSPTWFALMFPKIFAYIFAVCGIGGVIYSYFIYF